MEDYSLTPSTANEATSESCKKSENDSLDNYFLFNFCGWETSPLVLLALYAFLPA